MTDQPNILDVHSPGNRRTALMQPNFVFFMLDQLSAKWLEAARAGACPIPNMERLISRGVTFSNAFSSNPVCCPARATIATGLTTRQHGVLENGYQLDPDLPTFMRLLQQKGWRTGCFGKLHLRPHFAGLHPEYRVYGFDETHITEDPRGGEWLDWVKGEHPEWYEAALATIWPASIPEFAAYGPDRSNLANRILAVRRDFDWSSPAVPDGDWVHYALPFPEEVSQTAWITNHAVRFIQTAGSEQPFMAQISYVQPHSPFCAPPECFPKVNPDAIPEPVVPTWAEDPLHPAVWDAPDSHWAKNRVPQNWRSFRRCYFADIHHLDAQLGKVMAALTATGRIDNTYIVLLADHGEMLFDHGMSGKGNMHYDACIRVPLVVAGPGLKTGSTRNEFVQLEDIFPTVLDAAALACPPMPTQGPYLQDCPEVMTGRSLLPLCRGQETDGWRQTAYCESYNNITASSYDHWARTVRTTSFRYTWFPRGNGEQLFDLSRDPDEQNNVAADPLYRETRETLREELLNRIVLQDYPHPRRNLFAIGVH